MISGLIWKSAQTKKSGLDKFQRARSKQGSLNRGWCSGPCVWGSSGGPVAVQTNGFWWNKLGTPKTQLQDTLPSCGAPRAFAKDARVEFMKSARKSRDGRRASLPLVRRCLRQDIEKQMRNLAASGVDPCDSALCKRLMDTLGIEPRAFRVRRRCDTTLVG